MTWDEDTQNWAKEALKREWEKSLCDLEAWSRSMRAQPTILMNPTTADAHGIGCEHVWKQYIGLTQRYEYCTKCDEKKQ